jgi:hypothetical protein
MGLMRFLVPDRSVLPADAVERAYFTGLDEIPWRSRTTWTDEGLAVRRAEDDSGNFHIPFLAPGLGEISLQTACLMERDEPYHLTVELARGSINRIRNQLAIWQSMGIPIHDRPPALCHALELFSHAATERQDPAEADRHARQAIVESENLIVQLTSQYAEAAISARRKQSARSVPALAINLGSAPFGEATGRYVINTFNAASVPFSWSDIEALEGRRDWTLPDRQIEWSRANNLKIIAGPLLAFDHRGLPPWLFLYEGDSEALVSYVDDFVRTVVGRYKGRVQWWQVASRMNVQETFAFGEEERLRLAATIIETVRQLDPKTPISIAIDQPWGEYMRSQGCDFSPLHFADALVRADLGLSSIGLEINMGYATDATQPRNAIDFLRQIDRWSSLGLPLLLTLTAPGSSAADPKAHAKLKPLANGGEANLQMHCVKNLIPLLLSKPVVQGIIWNQLLDSVPHELPNAGLFDGTNHPKPAAAAFREIHSKFL